MTACSRHKGTVGTHVPGCDPCVIAQLRAELEQVKTAAEANRKHWEDQHCALLEIMEADRAKAQEDSDFQKDCLEATRRNGKTVCEQRDELRREVNKSRRYSFLWKLHTKALLVRIRELEGDLKESAELLEQREDAYQLLWESYDRAEPVLKACEDCLQESKGMVRYSTEESDCYWELAENLMALTAKRLGTAISRAVDADAAPKEGSE